MNTDKIIRESWPEAVQWYLTKLEYNGLGMLVYDDPNITPDFGDHKQWWTFSNTGENEYYTPLFIDLIDDYNQGDISGSNLSPIEDIKGFTMSQIEKYILPGSSNLSLLNIGLILNRPSNVSSEDLNNYILRYETDL